MFRSATRLLPLLAVAACAWLVPAAASATVVKATTSRDTEQLADELSVVRDQTSALLILASAPYDQVVLGLEGIAGTVRVVCSEATEDPTAVALGAGCIRAIAHPLAAGHLDVVVSRGADSWSGALLLIAGDVAVLHVDALLKLAARAEETTVAESEFDVAAFLDKLGARDGGASKTDYCRRVLAGMGDGDDRDRVVEACTEAATRAAEEAVEDTEELEADVELSDGLDVPEVDPSIALLYHPDGRPRILPRGTIPRRIAAVAALGGVAVSAGAALAWERRAELAYLDFRRAERVGDDPAMTQHLFFTQRHDLNRDVAVGVGVGLSVTAITFLAHQLIERRAFQRARAKAEADAAKLQGAE